MLISALPGFPVKEVLPRLLRTLETNARAILEAPPGAGKTTLVPLALLESNWLANGKIIMLEPRRLAAKASALRMAEILGEEVGQTVGFRVRLERAISDKTRIEVVTEGILTRLLQDDPTLEGISAIIFDEFHERSLQADLGLALALDAQQVLRPDLRILVMSATLDAAAVSAWLEAPVLTSQGRQFPIETHYISDAEIAAAGRYPAQRLASLVPKTIRQALHKHAEGDILVFLPGLGEIRKVAALLENTLPANTDLHQLHGELTLPQQQAALKMAPASRRKVVLATSIAETSLTIQGVKMVIDGGFARVPRFMPRTGLTTLETVPVSVAVADQRRGRAGRLGPGICYRLWSSADQLQLPAQLPPEIREADLSGLALELAIWGIEKPDNLKWLDLPPAAAFSQARDLLIRLEALSPEGKVTAHGKALAKFGLIPRLGHLIVRGEAAGFGATACMLASLLAERDVLKTAENNRSELLPDLQLRLELLAGGRPHTPGYFPDENALRRIKEQARNLQQRLTSRNKTIHPEAAGLLTALAYPERIAQRETSGRVRLITGQKAKLATELFAEAEFYGVAQLETGQDPRVFLAAPLSKAEILKHFSAQTDTVSEITWDAAKKRIIARKITRLGALILEETTLQNPDPDKVAEALLQALKQTGISKLLNQEETIKLRQRMAFLNQLEPGKWPDLSDENLEATLEDWLLPHLSGLRSLNDVNRLDFKEILLSEISWEQRNEMDKLAPTHFEVPTGSRIALDYSNPEAPVLAVRLQEIFGVLDTPKIGGGKVPLLIHLLSPASRPVQVTRDLRSFWTSGYFDVRKDLRGRYPKHHWPEDPLNADPVRGIKRKPK